MDSNVSPSGASSKIKRSLHDVEKQDSAKPQASSEKAVGRDVACAKIERY